MNFRLVTLLSVLSIALPLDVALAQRRGPAFTTTSPKPPPPVNIKPLRLTDFVNPKRGVARAPFEPICKFDYDKLMDMRKSHKPDGYGDPLFAAEKEGNLIVYCLGPDGPIPVNEAAAIFLRNDLEKSQFTYPDTDNNIEWLVRMHTGKGKNKILIDKSLISSVRRSSIFHTDIDSSIYFVDSESGVSEKINSLYTARGPPWLITATISPGLKCKLSDTSVPHALTKQLGEIPITIDDFVYVSFYSQRLSFMEPQINSLPNVKAVWHKCTNNSIEYVKRLFYQFRGKIVILNDHVENGEMVLEYAGKSVRIPLETLEREARSFGCTLIAAGCQAAQSDISAGYTGTPRKPAIVENINNALAQTTMLGFLKALPLPDCELIISEQIANRIRVSAVPKENLKYFVSMPKKQVVWRIEDAEWNMQSGIAIFHTEGSSQPTYRPSQLPPFQASHSNNPRPPDNFRTVEIQCTASSEPSWKWTLIGLIILVVLVLLWILWSLPDMPTGPLGPSPSPNGGPRRPSAEPPTPSPQPYGYVGRYPPTDGSDIPLPAGTHSCETHPVAERPTTPTPDGFIGRYPPTDGSAIPLPAGLRPHAHDAA